MRILVIAVKPMKQRTIIVFTCCPILISACAIGPDLSQSPRPHYVVYSQQETSSAPPAPPKAGWQPVAGHDAAGVARSIASVLEPKFLELGIAELRAAQLRKDVEIILWAMFEPNYDIYDDMMKIKGASMSDLAAPGFTNKMLEYGFYPKEQPELSESVDVTERIRFLWNHPAQRDAEWLSVDTDTVSCGRGLVALCGSPEWPSQGMYWQLSLYTPMGGRLMQEQGERLNQGEGDAVWIRVDGVFRSGMRNSMRINFYYDEEGQFWFPVTMCFGLDGEHRPFPML